MILKYISSLKLEKLEKPSLCDRLIETNLQFNHCNDCKLVGSHGIKPEWPISIHYLLPSLKYCTAALWWPIVTETCSYYFNKNRCCGRTIFKKVTVTTNYYFLTVLTLILRGNQWLASDFECFNAIRHNRASDPVWERYKCVRRNIKNIFLVTYSWNNSNY